MRIIQIVTQLEAAGAQGAAIAVAEELRRSGHSVETWFLYKKHAAFDGVTGVVVLAQHRPHVFGVPREFRRMVRKLREANADGVITYTHYANVLGNAAAAMAGVRARVATMRTPAGRYPAIARLLDKVFGTIGVYTDVIAVSNAVESSCAKYPRPYRSRLRVVMNGVALTAERMDREEARRRLDLQPAARIMLNVGRLHPAKNQRFLLGILSELPSWMLILVGEGALRSALEQEARDRGVYEHVRFVGQVDAPVVREYLAAADAFVFPSLYEGFGFAAVEALAAGLPVLANDIPSLREIFGGASASDFGVLLPLETDAWVQALSQLEVNEASRRRIALAATARAGVFSLAEMSQGYANTVSSALRRGAHD